MDGAPAPVPKLSPEYQQEQARQFGRFLVAVAFVGAWMAAGWDWKLGVNEYLLLGVPLTLLFQLVVARRPIRAMWVREAPPLRIDALWLLVTAALAALPVYEMTKLKLPQQWVGACWLACAALGAPAAAYAIQHYDRRVARSIPRVAAFVLFWCGLMVVGHFARKGFAVGGLGQAVWVGVKWTLLYFPVCFMLEEVTFRGALDGYVYRPKDKQGKALGMMLCVAWGLWHLPGVPTGELGIRPVLMVALIHGVVGTVLMVAWRIGGNLLVPAAAHALLDGVRNALMSLR